MTAARRDRYKDTIEMAGTQLNPTPGGPRLPECEALGVAARHPPGALLLWENSLMEHNYSEVMQAFRKYLLGRAAVMVETDELPAAALLEFQRAFEAGRVIAEEGGRAQAVRALAELWKIPLEKLEEDLHALETQSGMMRELYFREVVDKWLDALRRAYREGRAANPE